MAIKWHPDKNPDAKEKAAENFKKVGEAYKVFFRFCFAAWFHSAPTGREAERWMRNVLF